MTTLTKTESIVTISIPFHKIVRLARRKYLALNSDDWLATKKYSYSCVAIKNAAFDIVNKHIYVSELSTPYKLDTQIAQFHGYINKFGLDSYSTADYEDMVNFDDQQNARHIWLAFLEQASKEDGYTLDITIKAIPRTRAKRFTQN